MKITESQIEKAYQVAQRYYDSSGAIRITDARNELAGAGINPSSCADMIYGLKHLLNGERYTRTLSVVVTTLYLKWIDRDYGKIKMQNAVSALKQHVEYYQTLTGTPMKGHMDILSQYKDIASNANTFFISPEEALSPALKEGESRSISINVYERNPKARKQCLEVHGTICRVCDFDFEKKYGALGRGFIHVHHLRDLSSIGEEYEVDPIEDLRPVCPNCHAMLHKSKPAYPIDELRKLINKRN